jgi:phosphoribosylformylglycinamidine synthase
MDAVRRHADLGAPVLGVCNGFQILCEAGLLPGALMRNAGLKYVSRPVDVRIEHTDTPFTCAYRERAIIRIPIGHGEGRYVASDEVLDQLEGENRVVLRYIGGSADAPANPNGSSRDIAGICNRARNVLGMMPHPERLADAALGSDAGHGVFASLIQWAAGTAAPGHPPTVNGQRATIS